MPSDQSQKSKIFNFGTGVVGQATQRRRAVLSYAREYNSAIEYQQGQEVRHKREICVC